jgi:hypothetical protein
MLRPELPKRTFHCSIGGESAPTQKVLGPKSAGNSTGELGRRVRGCSGCVDDAVFNEYRNGDACGTANRLGQWRFLGAVAQVLGGARRALKVSMRWLLGWCPF